MVATRRSAVGMGYTGYPAHIFYMKIYFNQAQKHIDRLWILDEWFSDLRSYLPIFMESNTEKYEKDIKPLMGKADEELIQAWKFYQGHFEGQSFEGPELIFVRQLRTILLDLDEITAISKVIDKQKMDDQEMIV